MGKIFCVKFQKYPLKFHTKYLNHTLKDVILYNIEILRAIRFKSSYVFLKRPPDLLVVRLRNIYSKQGITLAMDFTYVNTWVPVTRKKGI